MPYTDQLEAILIVASQANRDKPCKLLPDYRVGGSSLARLLEFQYGSLWIPRIQLRESTRETAERWRIEIDNTV